MLRSSLIVSFVIVFFAHGSVGAYAPDRVVSLPNFPAFPSTTYAGYLTVGGGRQAFYYFAESQGIPSTDPLVVWFNGGPGCSSMEGNLAELGPVTLGSDGTFQVNPYSWNKISNSLFIEAPPGVGFSKDTKPPTTYTDDLTAQLNYEALQAFLTKFPEFGGRDLYLTGESYAGHYVPQLAQQIYSGSNTTIRSMMKGFMVGNPCTGDIGCGNADPTLDPFLQYHGFKPLSSSIPNKGGANYDPYDILVNTCANQRLARHINFPHPVMDAFKRRFKDVPTVDPCSDNVLTSFLNEAAVQTALHVTPTSWQECGGVDYDFNPKGVTDLYQNFMNNTNWKILVFGGSADTVVNFAQTETVIVGLGRTRTSDWTPWNYQSAKDGMQLGGFFVTFDRVSFATVNGAGHMVPEYQPGPALELFTSFLKTGKPGRQ